MNAPGEGERVTLAVLKRDIEQLTETVKDLVKAVEASNRCTAEITTRLAVAETRITTNAGEIDKLRTRDTAGSVITGAMAVIAGVIGALFKP